MALTSCSLCRMQELGLSRCDGKVVFGQVLGMADHLALAIGLSVCDSFHSSLIGVYL